MAKRLEETLDRLVRVVYGDGEAVKGLVHRVADLEEMLRSACDEVTKLERLIKDAEEGKTTLPHPLAVLPSRSGSDSFTIIKPEEDPALIDKKGVHLSWKLLKALIFWKGWPYVLSLLAAALAALQAYFRK